MKEKNYWASRVFIRGWKSQVRLENKKERHRHCDNMLSCHAYILHQLVPVWIPAALLPTQLPADVVEKANYVPRNLPTKLVSLSFGSAKPRLCSHFRSKAVGNLSLCILGNRCLQSVLWKVQRNFILYQFFHSSELDIGSHIIWWC